MEFADGQSILKEKEATGPKFAKDALVCIWTCVVSIFQKRTDSFSILHILLIRNILESLTVTDFQVASGILEKCVWILTLVSTECMIFC